MGEALGLVVKALGLAVKALGLAVKALELLGEALVLAVRPSEGVVMEETSELVARSVMKA